MADEKVNMGPEENKPPETLSPPGQGNLPPLEENNAPAVSGEDKAAPDHVEPDPPSADKHTQRTVLPGMGEDTPAPSGKVINLSDIQAADKGGKEASTTCLLYTSPCRHRVNSRASWAVSQRLQRSRLRWGLMLTWWTWHWSRHMSRYRCMILSIRTAETPYA